jgi:alkanesulfonate monooxygenase SsuD/methylene tetrahydromethanopterin reductase-like flavin-dependent oxidoreductase (luciferase family)
MTVAEQVKIDDLARPHHASSETFETQVEKGAAWVGTPETIAKQIRDYQQMVGGFEIASMQVNFSAIPLKDAKRSMRLFAQEAIERLYRQRSRTSRPPGGPMKNASRSRASAK